MKFTQKLSAISLGQGQVSCQCICGTTVSWHLYQPHQAPSRSHTCSTVKTPSCPRAFTHQPSASTPLGWELQQLPLQCPLTSQIHLHFFYSLHPPLQACKSCKKTFAVPSNSKDPAEPWQSQAVALDSGLCTQLQGAASLSCSAGHSVPWEGSLSSLFLPLQGPRAEAMLHNAMEQGNWVFFQNCHLAPSWMPSLERLIEAIDPSKVSRCPL